MTPAEKSNASQGANYRAPATGVETAPALYLPHDLAGRIRDAAIRAHPNECCGLIEGVAAAGGWRALAVHETANLAADPQRAFLIDPQVQFDLLRKLRGSERCIVGCFHSHPYGATAPSPRDRAQAQEPGFVWLIAGGDAASGFALAAYVTGDAAGDAAAVFSPVALHLS